MTDEPSDSREPEPNHSGRWQRTKRYVSGTKGAIVTVGAVAGAIVATWGLVELIRGTDEPQKTKAELVRQCEEAHGMNGATQKIPTDASTVVFASCVWPPSDLADPDGYLAISVRTEENDGGSEATGDSLADRISGPCHTYELTFGYNHMGNIEHTEPIRLTAGSRVQYPQQTPWTGALGFTPGGSELVVVHGIRYVVDHVRCA